MSSILLPKDVDSSNVSYSDVRLLENGGKVVWVNYNKSPLVIQTPEMSVPFGMKDWEGNKKFVMELSFKGKDNRPNLQTFYDMLASLDKKFVQDALDNQQSWFKGKKLTSLEVVEALYTPIVRHAKDKTTGEITDKYPSTFKVNVPYKDGKFACEVYDDKRELVDLNNIDTKGSKVTAIVQLAGLWIAGGKFGCTWKVVQMKVKPTVTFRGCAIMDVPEDAAVVDHDDEKEEQLNEDILPREVERPVDDAVEGSESDDETPKKSGKRRVSLKQR